MIRKLMVVIVLASLCSPAYSQEKQIPINEDTIEKMTQQELVKSFEAMDASEKQLYASTMSAISTLSELVDYMSGKLMLIREKQAKSFKSITDLKLKIVERLKTLQAESEKAARTKKSEADPVPIVKEK